MNESKQEAFSRRREFKRDAVRLVVEEQYSFKAAAVAVGVSDQTLRAWHATAGTFESLKHLLSDKPLRLPKPLGR